MRREVLCAFCAAAWVCGAVAQVTRQQVSVTLSFDSSPGPLLPTPFTIDLGAMGTSPATGQEANTPFVPFVQNERIWIHLPGFAGGWNVLTDSVTAFAADGSAVDGALSSVEWDPRNERIRLIVAQNVVAGGLQTIKFASAPMYSQFDDTVPNGLGPLAPRGGIDNNWIRLAWIRRYSPGSCSGGNLGGVEVCSVIRSSGATVLEYLFDDFTQTFATEFGRLPTQLIGPTGTITGPDFVYTAAGGSSDTQGASNCITVTFVSSVTFRSKEDDGAYITISGLSPETQRNPDNFEMPIYPDRAQCLTGRGRQVATYDERVFLAIHGTLTLRLAPPSYLVAGQLNTLTFRLNNPSSDHDSKRVSISASGPACLRDYKCEDADTQSATIEVKEIPSDGILESRSPYFTVKKVFQQRNGPDVDTVVFVTLQPSVDIFSGDGITIMGLCGTDFNAETITLVRTTGAEAVYPSSSQGNPVDALAGTLPASQGWRRDETELKLTLSNQGMRSGVLYTFGWVWRTKNRASPPCSLQISAGQKVLSEPMDNVDNSVGFIQAPQFTTLRIGQATTRPRVTNYICVTLVPNSAFRSETDGQGEFERGVITLTGLVGSTTPSTSAGRVFRCPNGVNANGDLTVDGLAFDADANSEAFKKWQILPNSGGARVFRVPGGTGADNNYVFDAGSGTATLSLAADFVMRAGMEYVFALSVQNSANSVGCQVVSFQASSQFYSQSSTQMEQSVSDRAIQDGVEDGDACVLKTYEPQFIARTIAQQNPLARDENVITVSLRPNVVIQSTTGVTAVITISGLERTRTSLATLGQANVPNTFAPSLTRLAFNQEAGTILASVTAGDCEGPRLNVRTRCLLPGFTYVFRFTLNNPENAQFAPDVRVEANYLAGEATRTMSMAFPPDEFKRALRVIPQADIMKTFKIGQTSPAPSARNAICVTLASWVGWSVVEEGRGDAFTTVTLSGFRDRFATSSQDQLIWHPETAGEFGNVALSSSPTVPGAAMRNRDPAGMIGSEAWLVRSDSKVKYDRAAGDVTFFLDNVRPEREFAFCFLVTNFATAQPGTCDGITLSVNSPGRGISSYTMTQDLSRSIAGYAAGSACVGMTSPRAFTHATLRSSSNVTRAKNTFFLELLPNAIVSKGQVLEISGLFGIEPAGGATGATEEVPIEVTRNGRRDVATLEPNAVLLSREGRMRFQIQDPGNLPSLDVVSQRFCLVVPTSVANWRSACVPTAGPTFFVVKFDVENGLLTTVPGRINVAVAATIPDLERNPSFPSATIDTGRTLRPRRKMMERSIKYSGRRSGHGTLSFTLITNSFIYGGESLLIDLPHHRMEGGSGEIFGITSSDTDAFTTFATSDAFRDSSDRGEAARAFFTEGYVADGVIPERSSGNTGPQLDGFFILAEQDPGRTADKRSWHAFEDSLWTGTYTQRANAVVSTVGGGTAPADVGPYAWNVSFSTLSFSLVDQDGANLNMAQISRDPRYRVFTGANNMHGMEVECDVATDKTRMVLWHNFVNLGNRYEVALFIERGFLQSNGNLAGSVNCQLKYKQTVGRYTGMRGMVSQTEVVFKQGAGPLYFVSDGSGRAPRYSALNGQPYTVYSRLEIVSKRGTEIEPGTEITISVPDVLFPPSMARQVTTDSEEAIESKVTFTIALVSALAGATSPKEGNLTGSFSIQLPELRPFLGPSTYPSALLRSFRGLYVDFFGAMSLRASGTVGSEVEKEVLNANYQSDNSTFWNSITLAEDQPLFATGRMETWAGAPVLLGFTGSTAERPRHLQLRIASHILPPVNDVQEVRFRGWNEIVPAPDDASSIQNFRFARESIEPLALPGRHYADGEFQSTLPNNAPVARTIDLIRAGSPVYVVSEVGNMIGMDGWDATYGSPGGDRSGGGHGIAAQAVTDRTLRQVTDWIARDSVQPDTSFLYQAPKLITGVTNQVWSNTVRQEPTLTYQTDDGVAYTLPPQMFSANIRAMVTVQRALPLPEARVPPDCAVVQPGTLVLGSAEAIDMTEIFEVNPCGVNLDTPTFDLGYERGVLSRLSILSRDSMRSQLTSAGIQDEDIASDIVRIQGSQDLSMLLSFLYKTSERRLLQTCSEGREYRVVELGVSRLASCNKCGAFCPGPARCSVGAGDWVMVEQDISVCNPEPDDDDRDDTGAIAGGVIGGTLGLLLLLGLCYLLVRDPPEPTPKMAHAIQVEKQLMSPVFIPESTSILQLDVMPNPAPLPGVDYHPPAAASQGPLQAMSSPIQTVAYGGHERATSIPPPSVQMPAFAMPPLSPPVPGRSNMSVPPQMPYPGSQAPQHPVYMANY